MAGGDGAKAYGRALLVAVVVALACTPAAGARDLPKEPITATFKQDEYATHYTIGLDDLQPPITVTWRLDLTCVDSGCPDNSGTLGAPRPAVDSGCNNA